MTTTHTSEPMRLAADFPSLSHEQWQDLVAKVVNRSRPEDRHLSGAAAEESLTYTTVDGLQIDPLYRLGAVDVSSLGAPGSMPFVRGSFADQPVTWDIRAFHDGPSDQVAAHIADDLSHGASSLFVKVGADAIPVASLASVLADVDLSTVPVSLISTDDQLGAARALLAVAGPELQGCLGVDPVGHAAVFGGQIDLSAVTDACTASSSHPQVRPLLADGTAFHNGGAGDVEELACAIATGIAYVRHLVTTGVSAAEAFGRIEFRAAATADQFLTIAKLRALRMLWARVGDVLDVPEAQRGAWVHAVTSWRMMTRDDPWVNMLRTTMGCFAAAVGGAQAITVLPFDSIAGFSDDLARRIARNTQLVVAQESHVGQVIDPAGGSWYVESLTAQLADAAWAFVQEIESAGGMVTALTDGLVQQRIAAVATERATRLAKRRLPLTGASMFPNVTEKPLLRTRRPAAPTPSSDGIQRLGHRRDAEMFEAMRDRTARHESTQGARPAVLLACHGARRDFGPRETFVSNYLGVAGIAAPLADGGDAAAMGAAAAGHRVAVVCSSPRVNGEQGAAVVAALRDAGVERIYIAGKAAELGDASLVDAAIYDGSDVVATLTDLLDFMGVEA